MTFSFIWLIKHILDSPLIKTGLSSFLCSPAGAFIVKSRISVYCYVSHDHLNYLSYRILQINYSLWLHLAHFVISSVNAGQGNIFVVFGASLIKGLYLVSDPFNRLTSLFSMISFFNDKGDSLRAEASRRNKAWLALL